MKAYIGCDPGKSGGVAVIYPDGGLESFKTPETEKDLYDLFVRLSQTTRKDAFCLIEKVHAMPGQGVTSMFNFGMGYGALRMAVRAVDIPFEGVTPQAWQKALGCLTGGDKNVSKSRAQDLFPKHRITHYVADAILIAEHARRKNL